MKTLKKLLPLVLTLTLIPVEVYALVCADENASDTAVKLAEDVSKIPYEEFDKKVCEAIMKGCQNFELMGASEAMEKQIQTYYDTLPDSIGKMKTHLKKIEDEIETLKKTEPVDYMKISQLRSQIKMSKPSLAEFEKDIQALEAHKKDPKTIPHPKDLKLKSGSFYGMGAMMGGGLAGGMTSGSDAGGSFTISDSGGMSGYGMPTGGMYLGYGGGAFGFGGSGGYVMNLPEEMEQQYIKSMDEYYKSLAEELPFEKKKLEQMQGMVKEGKLDAGFVSATESSVKMMEADFIAYENYLKDPKTIPHPMQSKGIGLPKELKQKKLKEQHETQYKSMISNAETQKKYIEEAKQKIADPATAPSLVEYYKSILNTFETMAQPNQKAIDAYNEYLKNPTADPDFLLKSPYESMSTSVLIEGQKDCSATKPYYSSIIEMLKNKKAGTCNITPSELAIINYYTGSGYGCMNSYLRQKKHKDESVELLITNLDKGLAKIPKYQGIVKRGASLPQNIRDLHKKGSIVPYDAFTSTSTSSGFGGPDQFYIYSKTGRPIMGFSGLEGENEVLFQSRTNFKVIDVRTENGINHYVMKEVSKDGKDDPEEDKKILEMVKASSAPDYSTSSYDKYYCPIDDKETIPGVIEQKNVPRMNYPKEETVTTN